MTEIISKKRRGGGSSNPIVFHDYESFIAKFTDNPRTTDECYTPRDVYEAVVKYVGEVYPLEDKQILRPFYPSGDYEHAEYPDDGVVIDNPPFSMFTKICQFYAERKIPFFLFGPGMTIFSCCKHGCTAIVICQSVEFENKAVVRLNFASNLFGDVAAMTAPRLDEYIKACPSQNVKANLSKYNYPDNLLSVSRMQSMASRGVCFSVKRSECVSVKSLDGMPRGKNLFGDHFLLSDDKAAIIHRHSHKAAIPVKLSERERAIVKGLG